MKIAEISEIDGIRLIMEGSDMEAEITEPYCCDLLSVAMGNAPAGCAWCTVMANMNTLAVASLTEAACVILCGGAACDENMTMKAKLEGITIFSTDAPIFDTALAVYHKLHA